MFNNKGFTIIETMIVLAISALLFVAAVAALNGQESQTAFVTSANTLQSQYQQYLAYDSDGYFNYNNNYTYQCYSSGLLSDNPGHSSLGTSSTCIFLGSIFSPKEYKLNVYQIWGSTTDSNGLVVNNYNQETYLFHGTNFSTVNTPQTLQFKKMFYGRTLQPLSSNQFVATVNSNSAKNGSQLGLGLEAVNDNKELPSGSFQPSLLTPTNLVIACYANPNTSTSSRYAVYYFSEGNGTINVNLKLQNRCP